MIGLRRKIAYGMGDMGLSVSYFAVSFFFLYYLTDLVGLEPFLAGLAWFIGQAWDSLNDPLMGVISDRTVSRFGRKRVYLLFGALPFAASFALLWVIPADGSQLLKFGFATLAMLAYTTLYSMVLVPYMALVPVMTADYDERTRIVGIRAILSTVGTLLGGAAAMLVSSFSSELTGLRVMALTFGLVVATAVLAAAHGVRGLETAEAAPRSPAWRSVRALLRDHNVSTLLLFKFLGAIATGSLMASLPYFAKNVLADEGRSTIGLGLYITVAAICIPIWERLSRHFDKRRLLLGAMLILAVIMAGIGLLVSDQATTGFYAGCALMGTVMSAYVLIAFSFPPDLVDHFECETDERPESLIFGLWLTVHQMGVAVAGLMLGMILQVAGYDGTAAQQAAPAVLAVRLSLGVVPGVAMILAVIVLQRYGITRHVYREIREALEARADGRRTGARA